MCMMALRMVVEVILDLVINESSVQSYDNFIANLEARAQKSGTCRLWLEPLIKPVLLMPDGIRQS